MQSRATSPGLCNEGTGVPVSIELRSGRCLETERLRPLAKMAGAITLTLALMLPAGAQDYSVIGVKLQNRANDVLAVMGFQVVPDLTTSSLSINDAGGENPTLVMSQIGAGFAISDSFPLFIEGGVSYGRYDPVFLASNGVDTLRVPVKWNSLAAGLGVGWDFRLTETLVLRPIANINTGLVASDLRVAGEVLEDKTGQDLDFLKKGALRTYGYGGSLVLDYEYYRPDYLIDAEVRYSVMRLDSYNSSETVRGHADIANLNVWTRLRAPLKDWTAFEKPLRYVVELTHSEFLTDDQRGVLGFDKLTSFGLGLEVETTTLDLPITRGRVVGRYEFGENVSGFSLGFAVSF